MLTVPAPYCLHSPESPLPCPYLTVSGTCASCVRHKVFVSLLLCDLCCCCLSLAPPCLFSQSLSFRSSTRISIPPHCQKVLQCGAYLVCPWSSLLDSVCVSVCVCVCVCVVSSLLVFSFSPLLVHPTGTLPSPFYQSSTCI